MNEETTTRRKKISSTQLQFLSEDVRDIINHYINKKSMSVHAFAKMCAVHPNQMYLFLNSDRGLNLTTVQKIGEIINKEMK
tara:strand:+ start:21569 stop:21811 length:243 start_codon:yes stop_codon:yes gene_type:complete